YPTNPDTTRNQLLGDEQDIYRTVLDREGVTSVRAIQPFVLAGVRTIQPQYSVPFGFGGSLPWMFTGAYPLPNVDPAWRYATLHSTYQLAIRSAGGLMTLGRQNAAFVNTTGNFLLDEQWRPLPGYIVSDGGIFVVDPETSEPFLPNALPSVAVKALYAPLDEIEDLDPDDRHVQVDVAQAGLDCLYHKTVVDAGEPPWRSPIARLVYNSGDSIPSAGTISVYDLSVDFNAASGGSVADLTDGLTRSINWGDGSPTELIPGTGLANAIAHHYLHAPAGTYVITLTVTNEHGLSATDTFEVPEIPVSEPDAQFNFA